MPEVVTIGETMVVFLPETPGPLRHVSSFRKSIAGAESNVAIALQRLGHSSGWISRVGDDEFGRYLLREIRGEGVDVSRVKITPQAPTGVMFKEIREGSETQVYYYRQGAAASLLKPTDLDPLYLGTAKILHLTGITPALSPSCLETVRAAIAIAKEKGVSISFDPNIRRKLWEPARAAAVLKEIIPQVDIFLPGVAEGRILVGQEEPEAMLEAFLALGVKLVALKLGREGCWLATAQENEKIPAFKLERSLEPIGAGDAFAAGLLSGILEGKPLGECGRRANAMGALATLTTGDIEGLPERDELIAFLESREELSR